MKSKLTDENFEKLSQLDRIEFRQRRDNVRRQYSFTTTVWLWINIWLATFLFIGLISVIWILTHSYIYLTIIFNAFILLMKFYLFLSVISIVFDIWVIWKQRKMMLKLENEYFNKIEKLPGRPKKVSITDFTDMRKK